MDNLPFSQACENNKQVILERLQKHFSHSQKVLELGAGTGQHACWFAQHMPHLQWQPSDVAANLALLSLRCDAYPGDNLLPPVALDVCEQPWPLAIPDAVFSANSFHIMPFAAVELCFAELGRRAAKGTLLCVYGPFNYHGAYTSASNQRFDQWLSQQHPDSAIRDFEAVDALAQAAGFVLLNDHAMPANNRLLVWQRQA
ncbi:DUF938 domain-containing protein [Parahaliea sp. F7430]|uniref:DUF938 domain-containing protein n=1 Tax=Sediminihaliea albiluteola TaxID=2758564 RepID=A0A7W2TX75_9GAMM|nr:DUF938 domain-containing protein [Sediminihaliea albiluteola]MBA6413622.1 DUF938 domain-containing protein [Sediminihaliea albiluteola]